MQSGVNSEQVSCICITYNRVDLLKQAILHFQQQTHENKELIILYQSDDLQTKRFVDLYDYCKRKTVSFSSDLKKYAILNKIENNSPLTFIEIPFDQNKVSLGTKRNIGVDVAQGKYVCMWDDDDWYPNHRIEYQLDFMLYSDKKACTLASILLHNRTTDELFVTGLRPEGWEGSLICEKSVIGKYHDLNKQEDTPVLHALQRSNHLCLMEEPDLYVYNVHSGNVSGSEHFKNILQFSTHVSVEHYAQYKGYLDNQTNHSTIHHSL